MKVWQTGKHAGRHKGRQVGWQTCRHTDGPIGSHAVVEAGRCADSQIQTNTLTCWQTDRQTRGQTCRHAARFPSKRPDVQVGSGQKYRQACRQMYRQVGNRKGDTQTGRTGDVNVPDTASYIRG